MLCSCCLHNCLLTAAAAAAAAAAATAAAAAAAAAAARAAAAAAAAAVAAATVAGFAVSSDAYNAVNTRWSMGKPPLEQLEAMPPLRRSLFREAYTKGNVQATAKM